MLMVSQVNSGWLRQKPNLQYVLRTSVSTIHSTSFIDVIHSTQSFSFWQYMLRPPCHLHANIFYLAQADFSYVHIIPIAPIAIPATLSRGCCSDSKDFAVTFSWLYVPRRITPSSCSWWLSKICNIDISVIHSLATTQLVPNGAHWLRLSTGNVCSGAWHTTLGGKWRITDIFSHCLKLYVISGKLM